jgi:hypothetical protein
LGASHQLSIRYNIEDARDLNQLVGATLDGGGIGAPSSGHNVFLNDQSMSGTLTTQIGSNMINTALGQYARRRYNFPGVTGDPISTFPMTCCSDITLVSSTRSGKPDIRVRLRVVDQGKHFVRFGADINHVRNYVLWPGFTPIRIILPALIASWILPIS